MQLSRCVSVIKHRVDGVRRLPFVPLFGDTRGPICRHSGTGFRLNPFQLDRPLSCSEIGLRHPPSTPSAMCVLRGGVCHLLDDVASRKPISRTTLGGSLLRVSSVGDLCRSPTAGKIAPPRSLIRVRRFLGLH